MFKEHSVIQTTQNQHFTSGIIPKGVQGVIVDIYKNGIGYEVEFDESCAPQIYPNPKGTFVITQMPDMIEAFPDQEKA